MGGADLFGSPQPLVGESGRHPQVEQHHVGWLLVNEPRQRRRVGGVAGHLDPAGGQGAGKALAQQRGVFGEDQPHGSSARTRVP